MTVNRQLSTGTTMRRCGLLLILIVTANVTTSCSRLFFSVAGDCNQRPSLVREWPSPDGTRKAVEQHYDCPGWYALAINVTAEGTTTTAFNDRPASQKRPPEWPDLKLEWKSDHELWITYPAGQDTTCISTAAGLKVHCIDGTVLR